MAKINGVDLDEIIALEASIRRDFGSIAVFAAETEVSYRRTLRSFSDADFNKEGFEKIRNAYDKSMKRRGPDGDIPFRISEKERSKIRLCVLENFNSYTDFCKKHRKFDVVYLTNVIKGNLKLKSVKYAKLVVLLNKKYDLGVDL